MPKTGAFPTPLKQYHPKGSNIVCKEVWQLAIGISLAYLQQHTTTTIIIIIIITTTTTLLLLEPAVFFTLTIAHHSCYLLLEVTMAAMQGASCC
jgi:hypothetical protein